MRAKNGLERSGILRSEYLDSFTTQATHKPFDALAVDAWATLAAEMGAADWLLQKGCSAPDSDPFDDGGTAGMSQRTREELQGTWWMTDFVEGAKLPTGPEFGSPWPGEFKSE